MYMCENNELFYTLIYKFFELKNDYYVQFKLEIRNLKWRSKNSSMYIEKDVCKCGKFYDASSATVSA